ncbi:hypothetical protein G7Z99_14785 [Pseudomonas entomophila]|uniref:hypothetical protein n=1 Tax=Pseudomonas entomophila TaxID=312306 RepID=UPI0015E4255E|nr:hypothetical protein [Pseudomonas entomophila]MBA1190299.1 hypothetical protein [Pseudomonas entomophila]
MQYITTNDCRLVANSALNIAGINIAMSNFDFAEFKYSQRKTLLSWSREGGEIYYGAAVRSKKISEKSLSFEVLTPGDVGIDLGPEELVLDSGIIECGRYVLSVEVYLDIPLKSFGEVPDHIKPLLEYSEIVHVIVKLENEEKPIFKTGRERQPVYNSYGELGFFIADLEKMNEYVVSKLGRGEVNLKDAFCETEIANELFDAGLLILVWGMTPTAYYIYGLESAEDARLIPSLEHPQFSGGYKFRPDIQNPSVVPGDYLLNWPKCMELDLPKISLIGESGWVEINVHVMGYYYLGVGTGPNFPVITARRSDEAKTSQPLLMVDMNFAKPKLCF